MRLAFYGAHRGIQRIKCNVHLGLSSAGSPDMVCIVALERIARQRETARLLRRHSTGHPWANSESRGQLYCVIAEASDRLTDLLMQLCSKLPLRGPRWVA